MRILIMGTPVESGNRGVTALGASIVDLCFGAAPNAEVGYLLVHRPSNDLLIHTRSGFREVSVITCRMSHHSAIRDHLGWILIMSFIYRFLPSRKIRSLIHKNTPWIASVADADLVGDVRGGDSFSDIYGLKRFFLAFLPVLTVILVKGSIVHFPQTYGPFRTRSARIIARFLLRRSSAVIARDRESQRIAQEMIGPSLSVKLSPDVAFSLYSKVPSELLVEPPLLGELAKDTIGINVNGLMYNGGYSRDNMFGLKLDYRAFLPDLIRKLLRDNHADVLLVPHTIAASGDPESDNEACRSVRDTLPVELQSRVGIVIGDYDAHQLKGIIGQCDFFVGARMHSCIAALSQGVPCVGVAYSMKFGGVFDSVGMLDWVVDGRVTDSEEAIKSIQNLYQSRESVRQVLAYNSEQARQKLSEVFRQLVDGKQQGDPTKVSEGARIVVQP